MKLRWIRLAVVLAACLPYLPTVDDYFTQDDFGVVQLLAGKPWGTFPQWFTMPWMEDIWGYTPDEIRPFVAFTYQITALPAASRTEVHHAFNLVLHALNALLVVAVARTGGGLRPIAACLAGVVFAILPVQAESVAWITGRVDSMPAFFYLATTLAYVRWRQGGRFAWYPSAIALFFVALFSKQNTITMVATLAVYDLLMVPALRRGSWWRAPVAWMPFAALTLAYLALRRALFGASVRGGVESGQQLAAAGEMIERHLLRTMFGHVGPLTTWEQATAVAIIVVVAVTVLCNRRWIPGAVCFGLSWWLIGVLPVVVAGYESPRHVYLAAAGWAFVVALCFEGLIGAADRFRVVRPLAFACAGALLLLYSVRLAGVVQAWGTWARVSRTAVDHVTREAAAAPEGALLVVNVPEKSWAWATPFVLRPPYAATDLSVRVHLVTPSSLNCCGRAQWNASTRAGLGAWRTRANSPIVALDVAPGTGTVSRLTDAERPELRTIVLALEGTDTAQALDRAIIDLSEQVVRRTPSR